MGPCPCLRHTSCSQFPSSSHSHLPPSCGDVCTCRLGLQQGGLQAGRAQGLGLDHRHRAGGLPHHAEHVRFRTLCVCWGRGQGREI